MPASSLAESLPLVVLDGIVEQPMFWQDGAPISRGRFAAGVMALAERLPARPWAVNLCDNRYAFCTALAAAALRGMTTLLPPSAGAATIAALRTAYPEGLIFGDEEGVAELVVPRHAPTSTLASLPMIDATQIVALVFTSGSTGQPQPHAKTWRSLHHAGVLISRRLLPHAPAAHLVTTVPLQHMYGLETAALLPLAAGHTVFTARPVFPDDVRAALAAVPAPRVLVTAPVHIRALLNSGTKLPPLVSVISATAPLSTELALQAEAAFGAPVHEIYGCTEAGSMASRRTVEGPDWRLLDGMTLSVTAKGARIVAEHLAQPVSLQDQLQPIADGFRLLGRSTDLLKVGGRRASLADLTQKLLSIPGVIDGVVFQPLAADGDGIVQRPAALVVAPSLSEAEITTALARLIDPIFLPRPLRKLAQLPRNAVGKLPHAALDRLLVQA